MMSHARPFTRSRLLALKGGRNEVYVGLLLIILGLAIVAFSRCPSKRDILHSRAPSTRPKVGGNAILPNPVTFGNAQLDGASRNGWWIGHFVEDSSLKRSSNVETKWTFHVAGTKHGSFTTNKVAISMAVLISGKHRLEFEGSYIILENPGDYVIWGPGVPHSWTALEDSTTLSIRWPSLVDDQMVHKRGHSPEHRQEKRIPMLHAGFIHGNDSKRKTEPHPFFGNHHDDETLEKSNEISDKDASRTIDDERAIGRAANLAHDDSHQLGLNPVVRKYARVDSTRNPANSRSHDREMKSRNATGVESHHTTET